MSITVFTNMLGKTITRVDGNVGDEKLEFVASDGSTFTFLYYQDCCASCRVEDICGDLSDLIGSPIVMAEEVDNMDEPYAGSDSYTWTFYRFGTAKGTITIRWLGESNGYYSESVSYEEMLAPTN
jgi:hypothetical protein